MTFLLTVLTIVGTLVFLALIAFGIAWWIALFIEQED